MCDQVALIQRRLFAVSFVFCLFSVPEGHSGAFAQVALPAGPPPQASPRTQPATPPPKMTPTRLAENGGSLVNGVYTNSVYGFSMNTPPGWAVVPPPAPPPALNPAERLLQERIQAIRIILILSENAPLKKNYERKTIQVSMVPLSAPSGPNTAPDYLAYAEKSAKEKGLRVEYLGHPEAVTINGQQLWKIKLNETQNDAVLHIAQYVIAQERAILQFMLVSPDEEGLESMKPAIQSLRFKQQATKKAPAKKKK